MLVLTLIRILMCAGAVVLVYHYGREDRGLVEKNRAWSDYLLINLVLLSIGLYLGLSLDPRRAAQVHEHDIFHYYMGSKYSAEVGHFDLYWCTVVADRENDEEGIYSTRTSERRIRSFSFPVRKMEDYKFVNSRSVIDRRDEYRSLFTDDRWGEFKRDVAFFRNAMGGGNRWIELFVDFGYNATPVWTMVVHELTERIPVDRAPGLLLFASLDPLLLALMVVVLWRTFGRRTALLSIVFLGTLFIMAPGTIRGAFLRLDWFALLVMTVCALKSDRYKTAGALVAYAGMARIFPLVFAFGIGARALWELVSNRRVERRYVEFLVTLAVVIVVLVSMTLLGDGGVDAWKSFESKIRFHDKHVSQYRVGFKPLLLAGGALIADDWPSRPFERARRFDDVKAVWWGAQVLALACAFVAVRRLEDYEALAAGWAVVYFLAAPAYYYQIMLLIPALLFLPKLAERSRVRGLVFLFGISVVGYLLWIRHNWEPIVADWRSLAWLRIDYSITLWLDAMLLLFALFVLGFGIRRSIARR